MTLAKQIFTIGALGDSITTAFNAEQPGDNELHSWVTGKAAASAGGSHFRRLSRLFPSLDVRCHNVAVAGARAAQLQGQVDRLLAVTPDYATLLIGANDLAYWLFGEPGQQIDRFVHDVRDALKRLIAANRRVMILIVAVPDQTQVLDHLVDRGARLPTGVIEPLRRVYRERWRSLNQALAAFAVELSGNVRFASAPATLPIFGSYLSPIDSYHPSVLGQEVLGSATWSDGYFPQFVG